MNCPKHPVPDTVCIHVYVYSIYIQIQDFKVQCLWEEAVQFTRAAANYAVPFLGCPNTL